MSKIKKEKLVPSHNNLVVAVEEDVYTGRLHIPETAKDRPSRGKVIGSGPGKMKPDGSGRMQMFFKVGDAVIFSKYGGTELKLDDVHVRLISEDDVLAKIEQVAV